MSDNYETKELFYPDGSLCRKEFLKNDVLHREGDLPAQIWYYESGEVSSEQYYQNGKLHRDGDLPAQIWYYESGEVYEIFFYSEGRFLFRLDRSLG